MDIDTVNDLANASNLITPFNTRELAPAATTTMPNSSPYQQPTTFSNPDAASDVIMGFVDAFIPKDKLAWFKRSSKPRIENEEQQDITLSTSKRSNWFSRPKKHQQPDQINPDFATSSSIPSTPTIGPKKVSSLSNHTAINQPVSSSSGFFGRFLGKRDLLDTPAPSTDANAFIPPAAETPSQPSANAKSALKTFMKPNSQFSNSSSNIKVKSNSVSSTSTAASSSGGAQQISKSSNQDSNKQQQQQPMKKEDVERNKRHQDVMDLLKGRKRLSPDFHNKYELGDILGDGAFGFVMTAMKKENSEEIAVKFIIKDKIPKELWMISEEHGAIPMEIKILSELRHPGIISYIDHFVEDDYIVLVSELHGTEWHSDNPRLNPKKNPNLRASDGKKDGVSDFAESSPLFRLTPEQQKELANRRRTSCDLFECIDAHTKMDERVVRHIFAQIALVVQHLHTNNVVHRDIKDENIVIDENYTVKLIDFGSAAFIPQFRDHFFTKFNGTAHFAAPEIAAGRAYKGPEAEIWALGVLLYTIVFGENPFSTRTDILRGEYRFPWKIDAMLANLLDRMLTYDDKKRANIDEVVEHPYLRDEVERIRAGFQFVSGPVRRKKSLI